GKLTDRPYQCRTVKFLPGQDTDLPHHHMVTGTLITFNRDTVYGHLRTFHDPQLDIDRIALHIYLHGVNVKEKIAVILIQGADIIPSLRIIIQPLIHLFFVVHIPFVDAELGSQNLIIMDIIACKGDVSIIVLLSFFYIQVDIDGIGIEGENRIPHDFGIPIASGVIKVDHTLLVVPEVTSDEFGSIEEV